MPQGTAPLNPDLPSSRPPIVAPDHVTGKVTGHASSPPSPPRMPWFLGCALQLPTGSRNHFSLLCPCRTWLLPVGSGPLRVGIQLDEGLNWARHPGTEPDLFRKESPTLKGFPPKLTQPCRLDVLLLAHGLLSSLHCQLESKGMEFSVQIDQDDLARASNPVHNFHLCPRGCGLNLPVDIITFFFFFLSTYHMLSVVPGTCSSSPGSCLCASPS